MATYLELMDLILVQPTMLQLMSNVLRRLIQTAAESCFFEVLTVGPKVSGAGRET